MSVKFICKYLFECKIENPGKLPVDCLQAPMRLTIVLIHRRITSGPLCLLLWLILTIRGFRRSTYK